MIEKVSELDAETRAACIEIAESLNDVSDECRDRADQWEEVLTRIQAEIAAA